MSSLALVIHLPADQLPAQGLPNLREAIHNYFGYRRDQEDRWLRLLFRDGRIALLGRSHDVIFGIAIEVALKKRRWIK